MLKMWIVAIMLYNMFVIANVARAVTVPMVAMDRDALPVFAFIFFAILAILKGLFSPFGLNHYCFS